MHDSAALAIEPGGVSPGQSALRSLTSKASNQGDGAASTITGILIDLQGMWDLDRGRLVCWWHASPSPVQQMTQQRPQGGVSSNHPCKGIAWPCSSIVGPLQDVTAPLPYPTGPKSLPKPAIWPTGAKHPIAQKLTRFQGLKGDIRGNTCHFSGFLKKKPLKSIL